MDQDVVQALFSAFIVIATMLLVGFPVHEALHAWTAMKLGDNTARFQGRVTLFTNAIGHRPQAARAHAPTASGINKSRLFLFSHA